MATKVKQPIPRRPLYKTSSMEFLFHGLGFFQEQFVITNTFVALGSGKTKRGRISLYFPRISQNGSILFNLHFAKLMSKQFVLLWQVSAEHNIIFMSTHRRFRFLHAVRTNTSVMRQHSILVSLFLLLSTNLIFDRFRYPLLKVSTDIINPSFWVICGGGRGFYLHKYWYRRDILEVRLLMALTWQIILSTSSWQGAKRFMLPSFLFMPNRFIHMMMIVWRPWCQTGISVELPSTSHVSFATYAIFIALIRVRNLYQNLRPKANLWNNQNKNSLTALSGTCTFWRKVPRFGKIADNQTHQLTLALGLLSVIQIRSSDYLRLERTPPMNVNMVWKELSYLQKKQSIVKDDDKHLPRLPPLHTVPMKSSRSFEPVESWWWMDLGRNLRLLFLSCALPFDFMNIGSGDVVCAGT